MVYSFQNISKELCKNNCSLRVKRNINKRISLPGLIPQDEEEYDLNGNEQLTTNTNSKNWLEYFKKHLKSVLFYIICAVLVILPLTCDIAIYNSIPRLWKELSGSKSVNNFELQNPTNTYLQALSPDMYNEILKELRQIQEAASFLYEKQLLIEEKTTMLQNELRHFLKNPTEIMNDRKMKNLIKEALDLHDADKLGLRDYALESAGGSVISTPGTEPYLSEARYVILGYFTFRTPSNPRQILQPDVHPGKCFAFKGTKGRIRIKLANKIYISAVTLEHCPLSLLTIEDIHSTPQDFELMGLYNENDNNGISLGSFRYSLDGTPVQTFLVSYPENSMPLLYTELVIRSNYGNLDYTCVYRIRIHGKRS